MGGGGNGMMEVCWWWDCGGRNLCVGADCVVRTVWEERTGPHAGRATEAATHQSAPRSGWAVEAATLRTNRGLSSTADAGRPPSPATKNNRLTLVRPRRGLSGLSGPTSLRGKHTIKRQGCTGGGRDAASGKPRPLTGKHLSRTSRGMP